MLNYFAGRRFNLIDMTFLGGAATLAFQGNLWWAVGSFFGGIALSVALERLNGQYK